VIPNAVFLLPPLLANSQTSTDSSKAECPAGFGRLVSLWNSWGKQLTLLAGEASLFGVVFHFPALLEIVGDC
jgi:hypothetical protein